MPELIKTADEAAWLEARRQGVTASEIAVIMGLAPDSHNSPYRLYHEKLGILGPAEQTEEMEVGHVLEPYIADKFAARHPELMVAGNGRELFRHDERPWQMATPDRLLCDDMRLDFEGDRVIEEFEPVAVLECKSDGGSDEWGEPGTDEIPVHYRCQVLWQMDVMGVGTAYVACLGLRDRKVREYVVQMDDAARKDLDLMLTAARDFLDRIDEQDEPAVDWRPATTEALKKLHPSLEDRDVVIGRQLEISYNAACKAFKAAERRKDEMTNRLREAMGSARRAVSREDLGRVVASRQIYQVGESVRKPYTVDKIVPAPKKEKKSVSANGR